MDQRRQSSLRNAGGFVTSNGGPLSPPDGQHYRDSTPVSPTSSVHSRAARESRHEVQSALDGLLSDNEDGGSNYGVYSPTSEYSRHPGEDAGMSPMASPTRGRRGSAAGGVLGVPPPIEVGFKPATPNATSSPGMRRAAVTL